MSKTKTDSPLLRPPRLRDLRYELSAIKDAVSLILNKRVAATINHSVPKRHILMVPGLGVGHWSFKPLQHFLEQNGHFCYDWELGRNRAGINFRPRLEDLPESWSFSHIPKSTGKIRSREIGVPYLCWKTVQRARYLAEHTNAPIVLLGWSLGGLIAREVARELPDHVDKVITFGSPVKGGPKYTITAWRFSKLGVDIEWLDDVIKHRNEIHIQQPITCIYSKRDGIVHWSSAVDDINPNVQLHEVTASHFGMGINKICWQIILNSLASTENFL